MSLLQTRTLIVELFIVMLVASPLVTAVGAAEQQAQEVLQRAITAAGGQRSLNRLKGPTMWMERGTFYGMGDGVPFVAQYSSKWPDWHRTEIEGAFTITVNGDQAWVKSTATTQLTGEMLAEQLTQTRLAWARRLFPLAGHAYQLSTIEGVEVDGRPTVGILARHADKRDVKLYFDQNTYLLAKVETMVISPQFGPKPVTSEAYFNDYKSLGGVMAPSRFKYFYDKQLFMEGETVDYKTGATLDAELFEPPH